MLVNCVAYENGEKVADLPLADIRGHLKGPGSFVWVALKDPDEAELQHPRRAIFLVMAAS